LPHRYQAQKSVEKRGGWAWGDSGARRAAARPAARAVSNNLPVDAGVPGVRMASENASESPGW
jgi:hypothetical protein